MKKLIFIFAMVIIYGGIASSASADILGFGTTALRLGSGGEYVVNLQTVLNNFAHDALVVDGNFGHGTLAAVENFQANNNLIADGVVGNVTKQVLASIQSQGGSTIGIVPVIDSITPNAAAVGTSVTLFGSGFSAADTVTFGGTPVTISSASASTITFTVPNYLNPCHGILTLCGAPVRLVTPGSYPIIVTLANSNVSSNPASFLVIDQNQQVTSSIINYNGQQYTFSGSAQCTISGQGGLEVGGSLPVTWQLGVTFGSTGPSLNNSIRFSLQSYANTPASFLQNGINVATQGVVINNNLTLNTFTTSLRNDVSVYWDTINQSGNTFSGNGHIVIQDNLQPNAAICNGTQTVNGQYINPSSPQYSSMCPSPTFPPQTIYFSCPSGTINPNIAYPEY